MLHFDCVRGEFVACSTNIYALVRTHCGLLFMRTYPSGVKALCSSQGYPFEVINWVTLLQGVVREGMTRNQRGYHTGHNQGLDRRCRCKNQGNAFGPYASQRANGFALPRRARRRSLQFAGVLQERTLLLCLFSLVWHRPTQPNPGEGEGQPLSSGGKFE